MKKQRGYINTDGIAFFFIAGLIAVVAMLFCAPFFVYYQYQDYKENQQLIRDCERNLLREQKCEIVKSAKIQQASSDELQNK